MSFGDLFLIIVAGLFGPLAAGNRFLALPVVAGEILAGMILGNSGLHWIDVHNETLQFLANFGFAMLLFVVGARLPVVDLFGGISGNARRGITAAVWTLILAVPLGYLVDHFVGLGHPIMFMLLAAASSTSTVLPVLSDRKVVGLEASILTVWIPIADVATMLLLPMAFGVGSIFHIMLGCLAVTVVGGLAFLALRWFRETDYGKRLRLLSKQRHWAFDMRLMLAVLVGLAALATKFGTGVLVAGFIAGLSSEILGQPTRMKRQTTGIAEGFAVPLFFVFIGARVDVAELFTSLNNIELCGMIVVAGLLAHLSAAKMARLPLTTGLIASQHMGLPAAIVGMGLGQHVLNPGQAAAVITASLVSLAVCLFGINRLPRAPDPEPKDKGHKEDSKDPSDCDCKND